MSRGAPATLTLDVTGAEIISGAGTFTSLGLTNAPMVMFTAATGSGYPYGVGSRGNDGTDYWGLDQAYPISTNGLLFDVGTTTAQWGQHPLFAIWDNGAKGFDTAFTGGVGGQAFYNLSGTGTAGAVPEPGTWALLGIGFAGLGLAGWKRSRTNRLAVAV